MKIYTKTGDDGSTALFGGKRVKKSDIRVDAYGHIDELNSFLGLLIAHVSEVSIKNSLQTIQHILFQLGSVIATVDKQYISKLPQLHESNIESLEMQMDVFEKSLPAMTHFILPGGSQDVALAHVCRTVCRRAERSLVELCEVEEETEGLTYSKKFLNRLSDYFFVLSRKLAQLNGQNDVIWNKEALLEKPN